MNSALSISDWGALMTRGISSRSLASVQPDTPVPWDGVRRCGA